MNRLLLVSIAAALMLLAVGRVCAGSYEEGMRQYHAKEFKKSRELLLNALSNYPDEKWVPRAEMYALRCLYNEKRYAEFRSEVAAVRQKRPNHPFDDQLTYLEACSLQNDQLWDEALKKFETFPLAFPDSPLATTLKRNIAACRKWATPDLLASGNTPSAAYRDWLVALHRTRFHERFLEHSEKYVAANPAPDNAAMISLLEMKSLRETRQIEKAHAKAAEILARWPESEPAKQIGGSGGRTEEQADNEFADITRHYHGKQFDACVMHVDQFIANYPQNWRVPEAFRYKCFALYHSGDREKFMEASNRFIEDQVDVTQSDHIAVLQAATLVKSGKYTEAQAFLEQCDTRYPESRHKSEFKKLLFDSYFYQKDYARLAAEANAWTTSKQRGTSEWAAGLLWQAIAKCHMDPPDFAGAATTLDLIAKSKYSDSNLGNHLPSAALFWRIWIAEKNGDLTKAKDCAKRLRDQMPRGPVRDEGLSKYSHLLADTQ